MNYVFEIIDKSGRKIRLTNKQWSHIRQDHPEIYDGEIIQLTIKNPDKIIQSYQGMKHYYYKYFKQRAPLDQYLMVVVNYLNGGGFIIQKKSFTTSFFLSQKFQRNF